ncbi:DUF5667 domain-containing protein [Micromonospora sp. NBC_01813]|nr:DUF5667 domain-containing protein [Micromonospora sp. NBC_01813]WSA06458.1 DUF5667 domain-containing protein [Micromonospora sp. NBC_01813]
MSKINFFRRRAERFAQLLDRNENGGRRHVRDPLDDELAGLTTLGRRMSEMQPPPASGVDPDFRAHLRAVLIATAEREGIGATASAVPESPRPGRTRSTRSRRLGARVAGTAAGRARARAAIIATVALGAITVSGMSAATEQALPGDTLYGMKRSTERAQLALAHSDVSRGQLFLGFAEVRMAEAQTVHDDATAFDAVLDDMDGQTRQGVRLLTTAAVQRGDQQPLDAIDAFVVTQRPSLRELSAVTSATRDRAAESLALLDAVRARTQSLRNGLTCTAPTDSDPDLDALGPLPTTCGTGQRTGETGIRVPQNQPTPPPAAEEPADVDGTEVAPAAGASQTPEQGGQPSNSPQQPTLAEPETGNAETALPNTPRPAVKDRPAADR